MQAARGASLNSSDHTEINLQTRFARRYVGLLATVAVLAYVVDVVSKIVAVDILTGQPPVEIIGRYFSLYLARNPGAAFSTGTGYTQVLTVIAMVAVVAVIWVGRRVGSPGWSIGLGFLLGGILGNLTDRIFRAPGPMHGHVIDFFMFPSFPIFNVADICINIAAATIIVQSVRGVRVDGRRDREAERSTEADS